MRELGIHIDLNKGKLGKQLSSEIRKLIKKGTLLPGEAVPSLRALASQLGVHRHTVRVVMEELASEGWIESVQRKGYFVAQDIPTEFFEAKEGRKQGAREAFEFKLKLDVDMPAFAPKERIKHNFQSGLPDLRLIPKDEIRSHVSDALRSRHRGVFDYGNTLGNPKLRETLMSYFRRLRGITSKEVAVVNGSQEGLYVISKLLLGKGDCVAMEEIGYAPARATFLAVGAEVVSIKMDPDGINVDDFEAKIRIHPIRAIFLTPLHQFPTTCILSITKRLRIYRLCQKHRIFIIEDDYDHEFHFRPTVEPMAANDPSNLVIYLSTFSKCVYPSARMGFVALPPALVQPFSQFKRILSHQNDGVIQEAIFRWIDSGGLERHLRKMRRVYLKRRDHMAEEINQRVMAGAKLSYELPQGGMALWLNVHRDSLRLAQKLAEHGTYVLPECNYRFDARRGTHLRLGYSNQNEEEISSGLKALWREIQ